MLGSTFVIVMTIILAIVILVCIGGIWTLVEQIKQKNDGFFFPVIAILLALCLIVLLGMIIAFLHGWGDYERFQSYIAYAFFALMAIALVYFISLGISFYKIGKK